MMMNMRRNSDKNDDEHTKTSWQRGYKDLLTKQSHSQNALVLFTKWRIHYTRGLFGFNSHSWSIRLLLTRVCQGPFMGGFRFRSLLWCLRLMASATRLWPLCLGCSVLTTELWRPIHWEQANLLISPDRTRESDITYNHYEDGLIYRNR